MAAADFEDIPFGYSLLEIAYLNLNSIHEEAFCIHSDLENVLNERIKII